MAKGKLLSNPKNWLAQLLQSTALKLAGLGIFMASCTTVNGRGLVSNDADRQLGTFVNAYPIDYPAFTIAAEDIAGSQSSHFNFSLVVASYRLMLSHNIPVNDASISKTVKYVIQARKVAGPRLLFGKGTRIINILHEYDSFNGLFAPTSVIRKELGLGARAEDIWTFQGPTEITLALRAIASSKGPLTVYIYAHAMGESFRLSDSASLSITELAVALKHRAGTWTNVLADECDGVITHLPAALREMNAELPSYIISSTPPGAMTRGSRLLNAISGTGTGTGTYFVDPSNLGLEDLAKSQDFVFLWTPTQAQTRQLEHAWPFPSRLMNIANAASYPAGIWELAQYPPRLPQNERFDIVALA